MATINRPRLRGVLVGRRILEEAAAVEFVDALAEEVEASVERAVERIERERELRRARRAAAHSERRQHIAEAHLRTVGLILGGVAVATAILAIVIAVT